MQNNTIEILAPSPTNTTTFSLSLPVANVTVGQRGNQVVFDCFWQGSNVQMGTRNFLYQALPYSWDDIAPTTPYNFVAFIVINQGTYVLLEKYR